MCHLRERVTLRTEGARIRIIDVCADVQATANSHGVITWAGCTGTVKLDADGGVELLFESDTFRGTMSASGARIDAWVPRNFAQPISIEGPAPEQVHRAPDLPPLTLIPRTASPQPLISPENVLLAAGDGGLWLHAYNR